MQYIWLEQLIKSKKNPLIKFLFPWWWFSKGLLSHNINSILTNQFNLIKATRFDNCHLKRAIFFRYFNIKMVISAVQI